MLKILVLTASPPELQTIQAEEEVSAIRHKLKHNEHGPQFDVEICFNATVDDLATKMRSYQPDILHFSGHALKGDLLFEGGGSGQRLPRAGLTRLFELQPGGLRCIVLNACRTTDLARDLARVIDCTVGILDSIDDEEAINLSKGFYESLAAGESVGHAVELAKNRVQLGGSPQHDNVVLFTRDDIDAQNVVLSYCVPAFCIAAESDSDYVSELLDTHLVPLTRAGVVSCWEPSRAIDAWDLEVETSAHLASAQLVLLLVSPDLLASKSRYALALRALERHSQRAARLVPILIRKVDVSQTVFKSLPILPGQDKALSEYRQRETAWVSILQSLRKIIDNIADKKKEQKRKAARATAGPAGGAQAASATGATPPAPGPTAQAAPAVQAAMPAAVPSHAAESVHAATTVHPGTTVHAAASAPSPTPFSVRALLNAMFRVDSDFSAFVLDNFAQTYRQWSTQADREHRLSALIARHPTTDIVNAAAQYDDFPRYRHLLKYS